MFKIIFTKRFSNKFIMNIILFIKIILFIILKR